MPDAARTAVASADGAGPVRGACPSGHRPFVAADGLLVRVRVPGGALSCAQLEAVATAAGRYGSGVVELTSRANLQLRGVRADGLGDVQAALLAAGLIPADAGADERRNVLAAPAAGLDPTEVADVRPLVRELLDRLATGAVPGSLHPKAGVLLDGGGAISVRGIGQDVAVGAVGRRDTGEVVAELALGRPLPLDPDPDATCLVVPLSAAAEVAAHALALTAGEHGPIPRADGPDRPAHPQHTTTGTADHPAHEHRSPDASLDRHADLGAAVARAIHEHEAVDARGTAPDSTTAAAIREHGPIDADDTPPDNDDTAPDGGAPGGQARRMHELVAEHTLDAIVAEIERRSGVTVTRVPAGLLDRAAPIPGAPLGVHRARPDGTVMVGAGPVLGRLDADALAGLAAGGARHGDGTVRLTPWRSVLVPGVPADRARALLGEVGALGLVTDPADPATSVVACVGRAGCEAGRTDALADARRLIDARRQAPGRGLHPSVHVSGCGKRCASRQVHDVTLVGVAPGRYDVLARDRRSGGERVTRRDAPFAEAVARP